MGAFFGVGTFRIGTVFKIKFKIVVIVFLWDLNLVPRSSQPSERTSGKIHFDGVIMCQECDLLRAHAFLHAFRNGGLWRCSGRLPSCNDGQGNLRGCVEMHSLQARNGGIVS